MAGEAVKNLKLVGLPPADYVYDADKLCHLACCTICGDPLDEETLDNGVCDTCMAEGSAGPR